jgi:hypothetical protein
MKNFLKKHFTKKRIIAFFVVRKIIALILIFSFLTPPPQVHAQAVPVANYVINRAIAGSVTKNIIRRGFAANDPRYAKTLEAISGNVTALNVASGTATVALTVLGAPVWLTIAASLGVFALGAWFYADNAKLRITNAGITYDPAPPIPVDYVASYPPVLQAKTYLDRYVLSGQKIYQGKSCFSTQPCAALPKFPAGYEPFVKLEIPSEITDQNMFGSGESIVVFNSVEELASSLVLYAKPPYENYSFATPMNTASNPLTVCGEQGCITYGFNWIIPPYIDASYYGQARIVARYTAYKSCSGYHCYSPGYDYMRPWVNPGQDWVSDETPHFPAGTPRLKFTVSLDGSPSTFESADALNDRLGTHQRNQPLTDESIAKLADAAWADAASKPGYLGIPYTNLDPVSADDVHEYLINHTRPTIGDLLRPAVAPGTDAVPIGEQGTGTGNAGGLIKDVNVVNVPDVNILNKIKLDLGEAPFILPKSDLDVVPFADFYEPFIKAVYDPNKLIPITFAGECPKPVIEVFGSSLVLDAHCLFIDVYAPVIAFVLSVVYSYVALTVLLSA